MVRVGPIWECKYQLWVLIKGCLFGLRSLDFLLCPSNSPISITWILGKLFGKLILVVLWWKTSECNNSRLWEWSLCPTFQKVPWPVRSGYEEACIMASFIPHCTSQKINLVAKWPNFLPEKVPWPVTDVYNLTIWPIRLWGGSYCDNAFSYYSIFLRPPLRPFPLG